MPGMNFTPPVPQLTAAQLAALGLAAFRPPGVMGMPGMGGVPMGQAPGFNMHDGMSGLSRALGALKGVGGATRTGGDADLGGYSKGGSMVDVGGGKMLPNPNGFSYDSAGNLIGPIKGGGSGGFSFLGDIGDWFGNLFGSGAGGAAGGGPGDLAGGAGGFFP
jgi:hypothetical protein